MPEEKHQELQEFRLCNHFVCHDKKVYKNLTKFTRTHLSIQNMQLGRITWKLLLFVVRLWKPVFSSRGGGIRSLLYLQRHGEEVWERHEGRLALSCSVMNSIIYSLVEILSSLSTNSPRNSLLVLHYTLHWPCHWDSLAWGKFHISELVFFCSLHICAPFWMVGFSGSQFV